MPSTAINIKQKRQNKASSCFLAIKITTFMFPTNGLNHKSLLLFTNVMPSQTQASQNPKKRLE